MATTYNNYPGVAQPAGTPQYYFPAQTIPQPQPTPQVNMIWVNGRAEAESYGIVPGTTLPLWDKNDPVIYLKSADHTGKVSIEVLDYTSREDDKTSDGVSREEFNKAIDKLSREINSIRSNFNNPNNSKYRGGDVNG